MDQESDPPTIHPMAIARVRYALLGQYCYGIGKRGAGSLTWLDIAADIEAYTGAEVGSEALRRFVSARPSEFSPLTRFLPAFVDYVCHPDVHLISKEELFADGLDFTAIVRLSGYLQDHSGIATNQFPADFRGTYETGPQSQENGSLSVYLRASQPRRLLEASSVPVLEAEEFSFLTDTYKNTRRVVGAAVHVGLAIWTPESNILGFLKHTVHGTNVYYASLSAIYDRSATRFERISFYRHGRYTAESLEDLVISGIVEYIRTEKDYLKEFSKLYRHNNSKYSIYNIQRSRFISGALTLSDNYEYWENNNPSEELISEIRRFRKAMGELLVRSAHECDLKGVIRCIKGDKASPDSKSERGGQTALHEAAGCVSRDIVRFLSSEGANFLVRDNRGRLPSEWAAANGLDPALTRYLMWREKRAGKDASPPVTPRMRENVPALGN